MYKSLKSVFLAGIVCATAVQAEVVERIVAKVNGEIITKTELDREVQTVLERLGPAPSAEEEARRLTELKQQILDQIINNMLIMQVARDKGLRVPPRYFQEYKANIMKESKIETEEEFQRQVELAGLTEATLQKQFEEVEVRPERKRLIKITSVKKGRHYDHANLVGGAKPIPDVLKALNWIFDDSPKWCIVDHFQVKPAKGEQEGTWIEIYEEIEDENVFFVSRAVIDEYNNIRDIPGNRKEFSSVSELKDFIGDRMCFIRKTYFEDPCVSWDLIVFEGEVLDKIKEVVKGKENPSEKNIQAHGEI